MMTDSISDTCSNCGRPQITPFCEWCGMPREDIILPGRVCIVCGQFAPSTNGAVYCDECGTPLAGSPTIQMWCDQIYEGGICPRCGRITELECRFCEQCGTPLHDLEEQPVLLPWDELVYT